MVITKSKELSEQNLQVQLYTGSAVDITNYGSVRASMVRPPSCLALALLGIRTSHISGELLAPLRAHSCLLCAHPSSIRSRAQIIDSHQVKGEDVEKALGACLQSLDPVTHIAQFPLKFNMGTRKSSVTIKFSMQLQVSLSRSASLSLSLPMRISWWRSVGWVLTSIVSSLRSVTARTR
jgi:hypothetical protein